MGAFRQTSIFIAAGMLGVSALSLTGCTSYTNVPGPESAPARQNPNARQAVSASEVALQWVVRRHTVSGPFALNLPAGTTRETADRIAAFVGPDAVVPEGDVGNLPVYHVTRVWIRLSDAKVDVVYPMIDGQGNRIDRGVTVWLHAGVRPWTVSRGQYWAPGTVPTPPIWIPRDDAAFVPYEEPADEAVQPEAVPEPTLVQPAAEPTAPATEPAPVQPGTVYQEIPVGGD
jgi:hypothetical protein